MESGARTRYEDCTACIARHGVPVLDADNQAAWSFYQLLQTQVRVGMAVVGLDLSVLPVVFNVWEIPPGADRRELVVKLLAIDAEYGAHRESEEKRRQDRQRGGRGLAAVR